MVLNKRSILRSAITGLSCLSSVSFLGHFHNAWGQVSQPQTINSSVTEFNALNLTDLTSEASLKARVSFEARQMTLLELLALVKKQSGVNLISAPGSRAEMLRVTARIKDMPLIELMRSLTQLFGVVWTSDNGNFMLHGSNEGQAEHNLRQLGDLTLIGAKAYTTNSQQESALADEILPLANIAALKSKAGFPVMQLPEELQQRLRRQLQQRMALHLLGPYKAANLASLTECKLRVRNLGNDHLEVAIVTPLQEEVTILPFDLPPTATPNEQLKQ